MTPEGPFYSEDGRRQAVFCKECGADNLLLAVDPAADELIVGCPDCETDVLLGDIRFADIELRFVTSGPESVDPALGGIRQALRSAQEDGDSR